MAAKTQRILLISWPLIVLCPSLWGPWISTPNSTEIRSVAAKITWMDYLWALALVRKDSRWCRVKSPMIPTSADRWEAIKGLSPDPPQEIVAVWTYVLMASRWKEAAKLNYKVHCFCHCPLEQHSVFWPVHPPQPPLYACHSIIMPPSLLQTSLNHYFLWLTESFVAWT